MSCGSGSGGGMHVGSHFTVPPSLVENYNVEVSVPIGKYENNTASQNILHGEAIGVGYLIENKLTFSG